MSNNSETVMFPRVALVGIGLIGSSLAHSLRQLKLCEHIAVTARTQRTLDTAVELGLADSVTLDIREAIEDTDLVVICTPMGTYGAIAEAMAPGLKAGCIVTDVGSVKASVARDVGPHLPAGVHLVPAHPVAGTEHSGPESGFPELFHDRWCILTPAADTDADAVKRVADLWERAGMNIQYMEPRYHDQVLAITSHLPHLIAYTIVGTATDLEDDLKAEVVKFSAGGFRDFTRIAASDPTMWRDIFLSNKDAILEMLGRFSEDLIALQRAIRHDESDKLHEVFTRTREIRRSIIDARQA